MVATPIGGLPETSELDLEGVHLTEEAHSKLFGFDRAGWQSEFEGVATFLDELGSRVPETLKAERIRISSALES